MILLEKFSCLKSKKLQVIGISTLAGSYVMILVFIAFTVILN